MQGKTDSPKKRKWVQTERALQTTSEINKTTPFEGEKKNKKVSGEIAANIT